MCLFKRGYVSIVETLISNPAHHGQKERPVFFRKRAKQSKVACEGYSEFKDLIRTPGNTSKSAKSRREGWQKEAVIK